MRYLDSPKFKTELSRLEVFLSLIDYRESTIQGFLQTVFERCEWHERTYHVSLDDADLEQLQSFLVYLHKPISKGGKELKPRSVNVYNVSIRRYRASVARAPIPLENLPLMKVDHTLPKVPTRQEVQKLIMGMQISACWNPLSEITGVRNSEERSAISGIGTSKI